MRIAVAAGYGLVGLLLGGPAVAVVSVVILPFLVAAFRLLVRPPEAIAPGA